MVDQITTFVEMLFLIDLDAYTPLPEPNRAVFNQLRHLRDLGNKGDNTSLLVHLAPLGQDEIIRVFATGALNADTLISEQIASLGDRLQHDTSPSLRIAIAKKLQQVSNAVTILYFLPALIKEQDPQVRSILAQAIRLSKASLNHTEKVTHLLTALKNSNRYREQLDCYSLITAIALTDAQLTKPESRFVLTDYLISQVKNYHKDQRMLGILAALILSSCGDNLNLANERITKVMSTLNEIESIFQPLRVALNGLFTSAELEANLQITFQEPIANMYQQMEEKWQQIVKGVQFSLWGHTILSWLIAIMGLIILTVSLILFFDDQDLSIKSILGIGIALIFLAVSLLYTKSTKEVGQIIEGFWIANMTYANFKQHSMAVEHTFARLYLQNKLTSQEMESLGNQMTTTLDNSIKSFQGKGKMSVDDFLEQL